MTTEAPKHESKALRRRRVNLARRTKAYEMLLARIGKGVTGTPAGFHKPGSGKKS